MATSCSRLCFVCILTVLTLTAGRSLAQCENETVFPTGGQPSDDFGNSLQLNDDLLIVGAPENDTLDESAGTAYIYRRTDGLWYLEKQLFSPDGLGYDDFGFSVSIHDDVAVVGAPRVDGVGGNSGAAYVYRMGEGGWAFEQKLIALDEALNDRFGTCVRTEDERIFIGSTQDDDGAINTGSVYVYEHNGVVWTHKQKLVSDAPTELAQFGYSISIDGSTLAIGAWQQEVDGFAGAGAVHMYKLQGDWTLQQVVTANDPAEHQWFGRDLDLDGDVLLTGASGDTVQGQVEAGSVYFFQRQGNNWVQSLKASAFDFEANDRFGWSVALRGQEATIGTAGLAVRAYRYSCEGDAWHDSGTVISAADGLTGEYGWTVEMDQSMIAVADRAADGTGLVFTFLLEGSDCNGTGLCDSLDIAIGLSDDGDVDGVPDECAAAGDLNGDGNIDAVDLALLLGVWGECDQLPGCLADLFIDGSIDAQDLAILLGGWD